MFGLAEAGVDFNRLAIKPLLDRQQAFFVSGLVVFVGGYGISEGVGSQVPAEVKAVPAIRHEWVSAQYAADPLVYLVCHLAE